MTTLRVVAGHPRPLQCMLRRPQRIATNPRKHLYCRPVFTYTEESTSLEFNTQSQHCKTIDTTALSPRYLYPLTGSSKSEATFRDPTTMLIGICGSICAGKHTTAEYLVQHHAFLRLHLPSSTQLQPLRPPLNTYSPQAPSPDLDHLRLLPSVTDQVGTRGLSFPDVESLLEFVTKRWREHWVLTDIYEEATLELLLRRPFFLLINVDAPVGVRFGRFSERYVTDFLLCHGPSYRPFWPWRSSSTFVLCVGARLQKKGYIMHTHASGLSRIRIQNPLATYSSLSSGMAVRSARWERHKINDQVWLTQTCDHFLDVENETSHQCPCQISSITTTSNSTAPTAQYPHHLRPRIIHHRQPAPPSPPSSPTPTSQSSTPTPPPNPTQPSSTPSTSPAPPVSAQPGTPTS